MIRELSKPADGPESGPVDVVVVRAMEVEDKWRSVKKINLPFLSSLSSRISSLLPTLLVEIRFGLFLFWFVVFVFVFVPPGVIVYAVALGAAFFFGSA